jgi:hypothetical protein
MAEHFPNGIKIGPDLDTTSEDDRLPIYDFDEWCPQSGIGVMSANETRTLTFTDLSTFRPGQTLVVRPLNPDQFNQDKLLILHVWCPNVGIVKIIVKNLENSEVDFGNDQLNIGGWNTSNP